MSTTEHYFVKPRPFFRSKGSMLISQAIGKVCCCFCASTAVVIFISVAFLTSPEFSVTYSAAAYQVRPKGNPVSPAGSTSFVYHRHWDRGDIVPMHPSSPFLALLASSKSSMKAGRVPYDRRNNIALPTRVLSDAERQQPVERTSGPPKSAAFAQPSVYTKNAVEKKTSRIATRRLLQLIFMQKHGACTTSRGLPGTCLANFECGRRKGFPDGTCDFGVCCVFLARCNDVISQNGTYFVNRNYPSTDMQADVCQATIPRQPNVCQLRLDFLVFRLKGPDAGTCYDDRFLVSGLDPSRAVPPICGVNDEQHIYISCEGSQPTITLNVLLMNKGDRAWVIRVSSIPCDSPMRAPDGCLQYFGGYTGTITSFNYNTGGQDGQYFNNLDYAVCLRKELGHCSVTYNNREVFQILNVGSRKFGYSSSSLTTSKGAAGAGIFQCPDDYVVLTGGLRLCGEKLNDGSRIPNSAVNGPVTETSGGPWIVRFVTNNGFCGRGWRLHYAQNSCVGGHY